MLNPKPRSDQVLSPSSPSSEKEPSESYVEEASETERLIEEIKQLKTKNECLQKKNNMFEENEPRFLSEASVKIKNNLVVLLV